MKLPRSLSGSELIKALRSVGYDVTRQTGSHIRLTHTKPSPHHVTIPNHDPLRVGTLSSILSDIARHLARIIHEVLSRGAIGAVKTVLFRDLPRRHTVQYVEKRIEENGRYSRSYGFAVKRS